LARGTNEAGGSEGKAVAVRQDESNDGVTDLNPPPTKAAVTQ
jgi:hypothetical protein